MTLEPSPEPGPEELRRTQVLVQRTILAGWICVALSALFLLLSKTVSSDPSGSANYLWAILLMAARMCGITSFAIGLVAIYNRRWTSGVLMLLCAVWLPVIAFFVLGTI